MYKTGFPNVALALGNVLSREIMTDLPDKELQWQKVAESELGSLWSMEGSLDTWSWSLNVPVVSSLSEDDEVACPFIFYSCSPILLPASQHNCVNLGCQGNKVNVYQVNKKYRSMPLLHHIKATPYGQPGKKSRCYTVMTHACQWRHQHLKPHKHQIQQHTNREIQVKELQIQNHTRAMAT